VLNRTGPSDRNPTVESGWGGLAQRLSSATARAGEAAAWRGGGSTRLRGSAALAARANSGRRHAAAGLAGAAQNRAPNLGFTRGEAGEDEGATKNAMVVSRGQGRSRMEPSAVRDGHGAPASNRRGAGAGERGEKGLEASSPCGETSAAAGRQGEAAGRRIDGGGSRSSHAAALREGAWSEGEIGRREHGARACVL
jgi:hypothetical protein